MIKRESRLPASVFEIAEVIGREKALLLVSQASRCYPPSRGASRCESLQVYVPQPQKLLNHKLVRVLGYNDAMKLARVFGGNIVKLANCQELYRPFRDAAIVRCHKAGVPLSLIAEWFDVSVAHAKNTVRDERNGAPE